MKYMITEFKIFENLNEPQVGEYVICSGENLLDDLKYFFENSVGEIVDYYDGKKYVKNRIPISFMIYYENYNLDYNNYSRYFTFLKDQIVHWSKDKEELEMIIQANKYNL